MSTPDHLVPVNHSMTPEKPEPLGGHHTARYFARRVKESLATRVSKSLCIIFLSLLLFVGIILFILWLSLRPHRPRFHIRGFSLPGLGQSSGFENAEINFNVTARNSNQKIGIYYYSMGGTVFYKDTAVGSTALLADTLYQGPKNTSVLIATLSGASLTVSNERWTQFMAERSRGRVEFRLEIKANMRFKVTTWWDSKRHTLHASCLAVVGSDGMLLPAYKDKKCPLYFT